MASPSSPHCTYTLTPPAINPIIAPAEVVRVFSLHTRRLLMIAVACWIAVWLLFALWPGKTNHAAQAQLLLSTLCIVNFISGLLTLVRLLQAQEHGYSVTLFNMDTALFVTVGVLSTGHWLLVESVHPFVLLY